MKDWLVDVFGRLVSVAIALLTIGVMAAGGFAALWAVHLVIPPTSTGINGLAFGAGVLFTCALIWVFTGRSILDWIFNA